MIAITVDASPVRVDATMRRVEVRSAVTSGGGKCQAVLAPGQPISNLS
jgi:hypothetical protein